MARTPPRGIDESRLAALSAVQPRGWFLDHIASAGTHCGCTTDAPDPTCDDGEALYRLRAKEIGAAIPKAVA